MALLALGLLLSFGTATVCPLLLEESGVFRDSCGVVTNGAVTLGSNYWCQWVIEAPISCSVTFTVTAISLQYCSGGCDYLEIGDGFYNSFAATATISGTSNIYNDVNVISLPYTVMSNTNLASVVLTTDGSTNSNNFYVSWTHVCGTPPSYTFFRLRLLDSKNCGGNSGTHQLAEWQLFNSSFARVFPSSSSGPGTPALAFDNNPTTTWDSGPAACGPTGPAITISFASPVTITQYTLLASSISATETLTAWLIEGSTDGSSWTFLSSAAINYGWTAGMSLASCQLFPRPFVNILPFGGGDGTSIGWTMSGSLTQSSASPTQIFNKFLLLSAGSTATYTVDVSQWAAQLDASTTQIIATVMLMRGLSASVSLTYLSASQTTLGSDTGFTLQYDQYADIYQAGGGAPPATRFVRITLASSGNLARFDNIRLEIGTQPTWFCHSAADGGQVTIVRNSRGLLSDGPISYYSGASWNIRVQPYFGGGSGRIRLSADLNPDTAVLLQIDLRSNTDYVYIYDGTATSGTAVSTATGSNMNPQTVTSTGTSLTMGFRPANDGISVNNQGFTLRYWAKAFPVISNISAVSWSAPMTLTGSFFLYDSTASDISVAINSNSACPITSITNTQIVCTFPAQSGLAGGVAYTVRVTNDFVTDQSSRTVTVPVTPSLTGISPVTGTAGTVITLTGLFLSTTISAYTITVGGFVCPVVAGSLVTSLQISCVAPTGPAAGSSAAVTIVVAGFGATTETRNFQYATAPTLASITPRPEGQAGVTITLSGTGFGTSTADFSVRFGSTAATYSALNDTYAVVVVPSGTTPSTAALTVVRFGTLTSNSITFTYFSTPSISTVSPAGALAGATITIVGSNFGASLDALTVFVGSTSCSSIAFSGVNLTCVVPTLTAGSYSIRVRRSQVDSATASFSVINAMTISTVAPTGGAVGSTVSITGSGFEASNIAVAVGGVLCSSATVLTASSLTCVIAPTTPLGIRGISVTRFATQATGTVTFNVVAPRLNGSPALTPTGGAPGTVITVSGQFGSILSLSNVQVTVGGVVCASLASVSLSTTSTLTCVVPTLSASGAAAVVVTHYGVATPESVSFTFFFAPAVTGVTPNPATIGSTLSLSGSSLGPSGEGQVVTLTQGATVANISTLTVVTTDTLLTCAMPSGFVDGTVAATVRRFATTSSSASFSLLTTPVVSFLSASAIEPKGGDVLTITGTLGTTCAEGQYAVTVGGSSCAVVAGSLSGCSSIQCVLPTGSGVATVLVYRSGFVSNSNIQFAYPSPPTITSVAPALGLAGSTITISGTLFGTNITALSATVGTSACTSLAFNGADLVCVVPALSLGTFAVAVLRRGTSSSSPASFTIIAQPTIASVSPSVIVPGASLTITGTSFGTTASDLSVTVGAAACTSIAIITASTVLTCTLSTSASLGTATVTLLRGLTPASSLPTVRVVSERNALLALYNSTAGAAWTTRTSWNTSASYCTWFGVTCAANGINVQTLSLPNNNLAGALPSQIGDFFFLQTLNLATNVLGGSVPITICDLGRLTTLSLATNSIQGAIPSCVGSLSALQTLDLSQNQLTSTIPTALGALANLQILRIPQNRISGGLPSSLASLSQLTELSAWSNRLAGSVPSQLGSLALSALYLSTNQLTGSVPAALCGIAQKSLGCNFLSSACSAAQAVCGNEDCGVRSSSATCRNTCETYNETLGVTGLFCTTSCGSLTRTSIGTRAYQCQSAVVCTTGCLTCAGLGLALLSTNCTSCNAALNYSVSLDGSVCTTTCGSNQVVAVGSNGRSCQCDTSNGWFPNAARSACVLCSSGQYYDYTESRCKSCHPDCVTCNGGGSSDCLSCPFGVQLLASGLSTSCAGSCSTCKETFSRDPSTLQCACPPGATLQGSSCALCGVDSYAPGFGNSKACTSCGALRTTGGVSGKTAASDCACLPSLVVDPATDACVCPPGTRFSAATTSCVACSAGTYQESYGLADTCTACPTHTDTAGLSAQTNRTACVCQATFQTNPATQLCECPPGYFEQNGACTVCSPGTYKSVFGPFQSVGSLCQSCPGNSITSTSGQTSALACTCLESFFPDPVTGACVCPPGTRFSAATTSCVACSAGTYQESYSLADTCTACPTHTDTAGLSAQTNRTACVCQATFQTNPATQLCECPPGYFEQNGACAVCSPGTYKSVFGPFQSVGVACQACPGNSGTTQAAQTDVSSCTCDISFEADPVTGACVCPPGRYQDSGRCALCPPNTYKSVYGAFESVGVLCQACPAFSGTNAQEGQISASNCSCLPTFQVDPSSQLCLCPPGSRYSAGAGACVLCPPGTFQDVFSLSDTCVDCPPNSDTAGLSGQLSSASCVCSDSYTPVGNPPTCECAPGYFELNGRCTVCPSGTYKGSYGPFESVGVLCQPCPQNSGTNNQVGQTAATDCVCSDTYSVDPATQLCECAPGLFEQNGRCSPCPANTYKTVFGGFQSAGVPCQPCTGNSATGGAEAQTSSSACQCFSGYMARNGTCQCPPGSYEDGPNCLACPLGTFKSEWGASQSVSALCESCPFGMTTPATAATSRLDCNCAAGFFRNSLDSLQSCTQCPNGLRRCDGVDVNSNDTVSSFADAMGVVVAPGWWYTEESSYLRRDGSQKFLLVKCSTPSLCLGDQCAEGTSGFDCPVCRGAGCKVCAVGYTGPLCEVCADGYALFAGDCIKCSSQGGSVALFVVLILIVLFFAYLLVKSASSTDEVGAGMSIKIMINHVQVLVFVGHFGVSWPQVVRRFFQIPEAAASISLFSNAISGKCGFGMDFFDMFILVLLQPLFILIILACVYGGLALLGRLLTKPSLMVMGDRNQYYQACLVLLYFIHPGLVNTTLSIFPCVHVGRRSFLEADMSIDCASPTYLKWRAFGAVYLAIYCFGLVGLLGAYLHKNRAFLAEKSGLNEVRERLKYILIGYNTDFRFFYLWDVFVTLRKMLIVLFATFFGPSLQVFCGSLLLYASFIVALHYRPYSEEAHQRMELLSVSILLLTCFTGLLFYTDVFLGFGALAGLTSAGIILTNGAFVLIVFLRAAYIVLSSSETVRQMQAAVALRATGRASQAQIQLEF